MRLLKVTGGIYYLQLLYVELINAINVKSVRKRNTLKNKEINEKQIRYQILRDSINCVYVYETIKNFINLENNTGLQ